MSTSATRTHIDDWLDKDPHGLIRKEVYARFMLEYFRMPATKQTELRTPLRSLRLFATYQGQRVRITGASRMGDVWITHDFKQSTGYQDRVFIDNLSEFSATPKFGATETGKEYYERWCVMTDTLPDWICLPEDQKAFWNSL